MLQPIEKRKVKKKLKYLISLGSREKEKNCERRLFLNNRNFYRNFPIPEKFFK